MFLRLFSAGLAVLALCGGSTAKPLVGNPGAVSFTLAAEPIEHFRKGEALARFGALAFRGGLVLHADNANFGGISGLTVEPDGQGFLAVSDAGLWVSGRFVEKEGRLAGIDQAAVGPMLGPAGEPLAAMGRDDTESIGLRGGMAFVGVEGVNEIWSFPFSRDGMMARGQQVTVTAGIKRLPGNRGLEALTPAPVGSALGDALVAISERSGGDDEPTKGFILGGPLAGEFLLQRKPSFDITDIAFLPGGDLLVLERRASFMGGFGMRLRRIAGAGIRPGAVLDGPVLLEAGPESEIDNMEALGVSRDETGRTVITLMSDDNFSFLQRSLVLRFTLVEE